MIFGNKIDSQGKKTLSPLLFGVVQHLHECSSYPSSNQWDLKVPGLLNVSENSLKWNTEKFPTKQNELTTNQITGFFDISEKRLIIKSETIFPERVDVSI